MLASAFAILKGHSVKPRSRAPSQHRCEELSDRLNAYIFRQRLGRGAFGQVFLAEVADDTTLGFGRKKHENRLVAVKVIRRAKLAKESTRALARAEAENLSRISETRSLFFTQLRETFSDAHNLYIVTDFLQGGTLRKEINRYYRMGRLIPNDRIVLIMAQLVEALSQIHKLRIVHRDIKPDNILFDSRGNVVLADFGLSRWFEEAESGESFEHDADENRKTERTTVACNSHLSIFNFWREKVTKKTTSDNPASENEVSGEDRISSISADKSCMTDTGCGTLSYAAPEMHCGQAYSFSVDIYSLGVVFHELLFDRLPPYPPIEAESIGGASEDWFMDTLTTSISTQEIEIDPAAFHLLKSLLALDPSKRISTLELRTHPYFSGVRWSTLAGQAYTLPSHHIAPSLPLTLLPYSGTINPGIFVDPLVVLEDGPDRALENAFNVQGCLQMKRRPDGKRKQWKASRVGKAFLSVHTRTMQAWDAARGREKRAVARDWTKDIRRQKESLVKVSNSKRDLEDAAEEKASSGIKIEAVSEQEGLSDMRSCASITASTGHSFSTPLVPEATQHVPPVHGYRRLRRVTVRIPSRSKPAPGIRMCMPSPTLHFNSESTGDAILDTDLESDLCSTTAVFARSFADPGSDTESNVQISSRRVRPVLARIATNLPPSSDASASSSSPFPSSFSLPFFLSRAFEHVHLPSEDQEEVRSDSDLEHPISSCPSLIPSSLLTASAISSVFPTPGRGNSRLAGDGQAFGDVKDALVHVEVGRGSVKWQGYS